MLITTSIVDFNFDLLFLDTFDAPVDIEHCWLVVIRERVLQVIGYQTGLADGGVTREHELELLYGHHDDNNEVVFIFSLNIFSIKD